MPEQKSKMPDLNEITGMATKLFNDIKDSVTDIIKDYKAKRDVDGAACATTCSAEKEKAAEAPKAKKTKEKAADIVDAPSAETRVVTEETKEDK